MNIAIMQPYFIPYIGYFQLINAVDAFVFYDDVNYIKNGWINRNRILVNGKATYYNVPQLNASPNRLINEVGVNQFSIDYNKLAKKIEITYKKAPCFNSVFPVIQHVLNKEYRFISEIAIESVQSCSEYLGINTKFYISSIDFPETRGLERAERIKKICYKLGGTTYINAIGGTGLYEKDDFAKAGIELHFLQSKPITYAQAGNEFVPWLSIIDVMMWNSREEIKEMLNQYELV